MLGIGKYSAAGAAQQGPQGRTPHGQPMGPQVLNRSGFRACVNNFFSSKLNS